MRRKFISALLFGVLLAGSTSTLVSCKDYDDDIASLRTEITTNATTLESMVTEKTNNLQTLINALQTEDTKLSNELTQAKTDLTAAIATAKSEANNYADVQAAAARVAAIEAAQTEVANAKAQLQAAIDDSNNRISALESKTATQEQQIAALVEADAALQTAINTAKAEVAQAAAQAQTAADNAQAAADAAQATANTNAENLKKISEDLTNVQTSLQSQITVLSDKVTALQTTVAENKAAVDAQLKTVTSSIESNAAAIEALKTSTAADKTELLEKIAANTAGLTDLSTKLAALQTVVDANLTEAKNYADTQVAALEAKLGTDIKDIQVRLLAVETLSKTNAEKIAAAEESIKKLQSADDEISKKLDQAIEDAKATHISLLNQIATVSNNLDALSKDVDAVKTSLEGTQTQLETLDGYVNGIMTQNLNTAITDISSIKEELATLTQSVKDYIEANDEAITKLQINLISGYNAAIEAEATTLRSELSTAVSGLESNISDLKKTLEGKDAELQKQINDIQKSITELKGDNGEISSLQSQIDELVAELEKAFGVDTQTSESKSVSRSSIAEAIANMKSTVEKRLNGYDESIQDLYLLITGTGGVQENMTALQNLLQDQINTLTGASIRLTSLVFAPTTYVDGVECIKFATLSYKDWGTDPTKWEADYATATEATIIDDAEQTVEYIANPKRIRKSDIVELSFVSNQATNALTRSVSENAPVKVASYDINSSNGVMTLKLTKNTKESFGTDANKFTIVSLKAKLSDEFLTDEQKKNGEQALVYSDWARLYETSETPHIHNTLAYDKAGKIDENGESAHFWSYKTVYNNKTKAAELPTSFNTKHIAKEVYYKDTVNLRSLVEVCDTKSTVYSEAKYGFAYEFHLMNYLLDNANSTQDATDQIHFGKLLNDTLLVSTARNGEEMNRDAINRQPMVQVVLKDTVNNKVVDVRYFKIKWIDKTEFIDYGELKLNNTADNYICDRKVEGWVLEEVLNGIYAKVDKSKSEFHALYTLNTSLYGSFENARDKANAVSALGSIAEVKDASGDGQTYNLKWTINTANQKATQAEYEAGKKVVTAYGYYQSKSNVNNRIIFKLVYTLPIDKMAYADDVNKDSTMWSNGRRNINPQLESDAYYGNTNYATTQIFGNFLQGYIIDGQTPSQNIDLVNNNGYNADINGGQAADEVKFVFDESKKADIASATQTKTSEWTISTDGLTLSYNGTPAATIVGDVIQLYESNNGAKGSVPSDGALLLVGKSVPVKLVDNWCNLTQVIDSYNVNFIMPLIFSDTSKDITLYDIQAGGSSAKTFAGTLTITENFGKNSRTVWDNKTSGSKTNKTLVAWYGVEGIEYLTSEAKTNIQLNGSIGSSCNVPLTSIKNADGTPKYNVSVNTKTSEITFYNKSGNAIGRSFKIQIPVRVKTKWQVMPATITITVQPSI